MDPIGDELLEVVVAELGYRERPGQHTKFGEWYSATVRDPRYRTAPWCDMFIAWAAEQADVTDYVGRFAWTPSHARWFETNGAWTAEPEPGALVFFDWSGGDDIRGIDHVGIVERVEGGTIHTIEANVDRVWLKRKVRDQEKVVGYGLPRKVRENLVRPSVEDGEDGADGADGADEAAQAGRPIEVRPAPAADTTALTLSDADGALPALLEPAPLTVLTVLVLGWAFLVARRRPRPAPSGRHRRRSGHRRTGGDRRDLID
ncbi:CHAP domain-containing protein [Planomonospora sp. ID82291]|uniref:CHAP domain-containing protein n=1 Tax=Planomonospora sp. ID82291 TaxID=2738136 RepID=UPI0018C40F42|nr:CHAP domain-containing protein [Planomonospora sp. ID82291]MBG0816693.1 CHAP domain-containing protein [Planomonospora sp. ID82291]